jgi:selenocysteine lyase/cysteine desulfurase
MGGIYGREMVVGPTHRRRLSAILESLSGGSAAELRLSAPTTSSSTSGKIQQGFKSNAFPARGKSLIRTAFMLSDEDVLLNHGSYGATPRMVIQRQQELVAQLESNPDTWFRYDFEPLWAEAVAAIADFVGSAHGDLAFVKNATAGVNAVTRQLELAPGDACLIADQTYGACANAVRDACHKAGCECIQLAIPRSALLDDDELATLLEHQLTSAP